MIESLRARVIITLITLTIAIVWMMPNVVNLKDSWWPSKDTLNYGLDIQGGLHLVLKVDVDDVMKEKTLRQVRGIKEDMTKKGIAFKSIEPSTEKATELYINVNNPADVATAVSYLNEYFGNELQVLEQSDNLIRVRYLDIAAAQGRKQIIDQAIEVIRNRVDEFGVAEPSITAQGDNRILVQLPGLENAEDAKALINKTARLDFRIVDDEFDVNTLNELIIEAEKAGDYSLGKDKLKYSAYVKRINSDLKGKIPKERVVVFEKAGNARTLEAGKVAYLVDAKAELTGALLESAFVSYDEYNKPQVSFNVSVEGRRKFRDFTGNNTGKRMAIVLDNVVKSAPVIQSAIESSGRITLGGSNYEESVKEAEFVSTALRAGALPATLEQLEERTVGPTLGADSIAKGKRAGLIGSVLVLIFMLFYYRRLGVVADIALMMNVLLILAVLTSLGATLTLPGVAGIVLTVGMAVDANVIIFERIKEELRKGSGVKSAIKDGFGHAFSAIFDANITTAAVCVVLMYFGTGPVRGFAVTLICGIVTSMFTAIFVSRTVLEVMINKFNMKKLLVAN